MLVPICAHFIFVKAPRYHAFFNPPPLNLARLQFELGNEMSQYKINGSGVAHANGNGPWAAYADSLSDETSESTQPEAEVTQGNGSLSSITDLFRDVGFGDQTQ